MIFMAEIDPKMEDRVNSLSGELKAEIMKRNVHIHDLQDLIRCLEEIVREN